MKQKTIEKWKRKREKMAANYFKDLRELGYTYSYLYIARYRKNKTTFYKVGVSVDPHSRVYRKGYSSTLVGLVRFDMAEAWDCETHILLQMMLKKYRYFPKKFDGTTECFRKSGFKYIRPYLQEKKMLFLELRIYKNKRLFKRSA